MKGLGCLIKDTTIAKDIAAIMEIAAAQLISKEGDNRFTVQYAYKMLYDAKVEIDQESVAAIYENTFNLNDGNFSSQADVNEFSTRDFRETLDNLRKIGEAETEETVQRIGRQSPGNAAARTIANIFRNAFVSGTKTESTMRQMQTLMQRAAQRKVDKSVLPQKEKQEKKSFEEILQAAFDFQDTKGIRTISGGMNGIREVLVEFKREMQAYKDGLKQSGASQEVIDNFEKYGQQVMDMTYDVFLSQTEANEVVKGALIDKGFYKTVTKKDGEKVKMLDWEKLSEGTGIQSFIEKNVTEALKDKGFTPDQIRRINESLYNEYEALTAQVIEKAAAKLNEQNEREATSKQNELDRRNKIQQYNQSIDAKRLARLYNLGLFEFTPENYEVLLNKTLGMSDIDSDTWQKLKMFGKAMTTLYSAKMVNAMGEEMDIPEAQLKAALNALSEQIGSILRQNQNRNSYIVMRGARVIDGWVMAGIRMILVSASNMLLDNPISGWVQLKRAEIRAWASGTLGGEEFKKQRKLLGSAIYNDIVRGRGESYGDITSSFFVRNGLDHLKNKIDDFTTGGEGRKSELVQMALSHYIGKGLLDGLDSAFKAKITHVNLVDRLVKALTDPNNQNRLKSKKEAMDFIAKGLLGHGYEKAEAQAREIISNVNNSAGTKVLNDSPQFVARLANDIVLGNLTGYQPGLDRNVITTNQVMAAYNSAYKIAGRDLGHVANNIISRAVNLVSGLITRELNDAVKEKEYLDGAGWTMASMLNRGMFNTFVSGSTNWIWTSAEGMGLGLVTGGINTVRQKVKNAKLDFGDDASIKDFEKILYEDGLRKSQLARGIVGATTGLLLSITALIAIRAALGDDDDDLLETIKKYNQFRRENPAVAKLTDKISPDMLAAFVAAYSDEKGEFKRYIGKKWSMGATDYGPGTKIAMAATYAAQGDSDRAWGQLGELTGQLVNAPMPWRIVKDIIEFSQDAAGDFKKPDYTQSKSYLEGVARNGVVQWVTGGKLFPKDAETFTYYGKKVPLTKELSDKLEKYQKEAIEAKMTKLKNLDEYKNLDEKKSADKELKKQLEKDAKDMGMKEAEERFIDENETYLEKEYDKIPDKDISEKDDILEKIKD